MGDWYEQLKMCQRRLIVAPSALRFCQLLPHAIFGLPSAEYGYSIKSLPSISSYLLQRPLMAYL